MGYTENISSILKWGNSFQRQFDFPLDRTSIHSSYEDAVRYARGEKGYNSGNYFTGVDEKDKPIVDTRGLCKLAYIGQTITVWGLNEKGKEGVWVYSLVPAPEGSDYLADLKPVGSATTETATNYTAAKTLSQGLAVGQLIKVDNDEMVDASGDSDDSDVTKITYKAGFYIVDAPGIISALGSSDDIANLEAKVNDDIKNLSNLIDDYQGTLGDVDDRLNTLEAFVDTHETISISEIEGLFETQTEE